MQYEIKNRWTMKTQFACELGDEFEHQGERERLGAAVLMAVKEKAYLSGADLSRADLRGAYLSCADLSGANLNGKKLIGDRPIFQVGPIGSESRLFFAFLTDAGLMLQAGCFFGTRDEFVQQLNNTHGDNEHAQEYMAALVLIDAHVKIWIPKSEDSHEYQNS